MLPKAHTRERRTPGQQNLPICLSAGDWRRLLRDYLESIVMIPDQPAGGS